MNTSQSTSLFSLAQLETRLCELREAAEEGGIPFSNKSADVTRATVALTHFHRPSIFLQDNGNIRFVWHSPSNESIGWQFLPDGQIQFVALERHRIKSGKTEPIEALLSLRKSKFAKFVIFE